MLQNMFIKLPSAQLSCLKCSLTHTQKNVIGDPLTLLVRGFSMSGLPFSLVCAHLQTEAQGRRDMVVLNLDNMVDSNWSGSCTGEKLLKKERNTT